MNGNPVLPWYYKPLFILTGIMSIIWWCLEYLTPADFGEKIYLTIGITLFIYLSHSIITHISLPREDEVH